MHPTTTSWTIFAALCAVFLAGCPAAGPAPTTPADIPAQYQKPGTDGYALVIEGWQSDEELRVIGPAWNDVWIKDCAIIGAKDDGIFVYDVEHLKISGCEIADIGGHGGIRLSATGGSRGVILENNHIHDVPYNGINAPQREAEGVQHLELVVRNNVVERTGLVGEGGLTHGLYIQAPDAVVAGNTVRESRDGSGISIRSSAHVYNNVVQGWLKSGLRYYTDDKRGDGPVLFENNMLVGDGDGAVIEARRASDTPAGYVAADVVVRFNTAVSTRGAAAIAIDDGIAALARVRVEGNLATGAIEGSAGTNAVLEAAHIVAQDPWDLHLAAPHPQRGAFDALGAPATDIDGQTRPTSGRDPGADQFEYSSP